MIYVALALVLVTALFIIAMYLRPSLLNKEVKEIKTDAKVNRDFNAKEGDCVRD